MISERLEPSAGRSTRRGLSNPRVCAVEDAFCMWRVSCRDIVAIVGPCKLADVAVLVLKWSNGYGASETWGGAWCWRLGWAVSSA